ncbi:cytochrome P450 monooxygenase [Mycena metata]|uniref:Cytochrome P450 monooxygenase n=1 Tax=Mycena metata TaxID=1033252 RepID=A0AAD7I4C3_9AGAR|nr:cytochrome P450 monooxygenase [Mycena metata]
MLAALLLACCVYSIVSYLLDPHGLRKYPGPFFAKFTYGWLLWLGITRRRAEKIQEIHRKYGPIVRISPIQLSFSQPTAYSQIYSFNNKVTKSSFYDSFGSTGMGLKNVFTARSKTEHGQKRKLLHPLFTPQVSREFTTRTAVIMGGLLDEWETRYVAGDNDIWFDCVPWMSWMAFDEMADFIFGEPFGMIHSTSDSVSVPKNWRLAFAGRSSLEQCPPRALKLHDIVSQRETYNYFIGLLPPWLKGFGRLVLRTQARSARIFSAFVAYKVTERLAIESNSARPSDLIGRFLHKAGVQYDAFQPESLISELITILVAGSDTTKNSLIAAIYYIASSRTVQSRLQEELDDHVAGRTPTFSDIEDLPFLGACLNETLRLYSPVGLGLPRTVPESGIWISGEHFRAGTTVGVPIYTIHRDQSVWGADAEEFRPERWLQDDTVVAKFTEAFKPFSDGSTGCIGKHLALAQLRVMIAAVFRRFDVNLEDSTRPLHVEDWFVRRARECRIGIRPRK